MPKNQPAYSAAMAERRLPKPLTAAGIRRQQRQGSECSLLSLSDAEGFQAAQPWKVHKCVMSRKPPEAFTNLETSSCQ